MLKIDILKQRSCRVTEVDLKEEKCEAELGI